MPQFNAVNRETQTSHRKAMLKQLASLALLTLLCLVSTAVLAQSEPNFPALSERVVDQANILDNAAEQALVEQLAAHEAETSNQIVVVTVNSLEGYDIADYALRLGRTWGIGTEEKNNGVILLVAPNERKVRIEVGYGLEGALPDGIAGQIIRRNILPQFKEQDYPGGIKSGVSAILQAVVGEYKAEPVRKPKSSSKGFDFIPLFFIGMIALPALLRSRGYYRLANAAFPGGFAGLAVSLISGNIIIGVLLGLCVFAGIFLLFSNIGGGPGNGDGMSRGTRHGGHGGGGFGGGGGFSGGGGGFGGGGASGSW